MRRLALLLALSALAPADPVGIEVRAAWYEPSDANGAVRYEVATDLPDRAILDVSLVAVREALSGPIEREVARGVGETYHGGCSGAIGELPAPVPPGVYLLRVALAEKQRDDVEEAIAGATRPVVERQAFVGEPDDLVEARATELRWIAERIVETGKVVDQLNGWIRLYNEGHLGGSASEYAAWRANSRPPVEELIERCALYHSRYPSAWPATYDTLSDLLLNLEDHDTALYRAANGIKEGNDPTPRKVQGVAYVEKKLDQARSRFVWESLFVLADLPSEVARMTVPETGMPDASSWAAWKRRLAKARSGIEVLARTMAPAAEERAVRAAGIAAALSREGQDASRRAAPSSAAVVVPRVAGSVAEAVQRLKDLEEAASKAPPGAPAPPELMRHRDEAMAAQQALRDQLRSVCR